MSEPASASLGMPQRHLVMVCQNRSCLRSGSDQVLREFQRHSCSQRLVSASGCMGQCGSGPMVRVFPEGSWYCRVRPQDVAEIVQQHLDRGQPIRRLLHPRFHPSQDAYSVGNST